MEKIKSEVQMKVIGGEYKVSIYEDNTFYIHSKTKFPEWVYREVKEIIEKRYGRT